MTMVTEPSPIPGPAGQAGVELKASELAMLLEGIDLRSIKRGKRLRIGPKTM